MSLTFEWPWELILYFRVLYGASNAWYADYCYQWYVCQSVCHAAVLHGGPDPHREGEKEMGKNLQIVDPPHISQEQLKVETWNCVCV